MPKIIRPARFAFRSDKARAAKRRDVKRRREERRQRMMRFFNRLFWIGVEPELMWESTIDEDGSAANDNS